MNKIIGYFVFISIFFGFILVSPVFAAQGPIQDIFGQINPPTAIVNLGPGAVGINNILNKLITIIYIIASILFIFMIVISAIQWIMSGGDKEAYTNARKRLTWAIIGITVLALAFVIATVIGQITGFNFYNGQPSTSPTTSTPSHPYRHYVFVHLGVIVEIIPVLDNQF